MVNFNKAEVNAISNRIKHGAICMACFQRESVLNETERDILRSGVAMLEEANKLLTGEDEIRIHISGSFCEETPGALSSLGVEDGKLFFTFTDESDLSKEEEE